MRRELNMNGIVSDVVNIFASLLDKTCQCFKLNFGIEKFNLPSEPKDEYDIVFTLPDNKNKVEIKVNKERLSLTFVENNGTRGIGTGMVLSHILDVMGNVDRSVLESNLETFVDYVCGRIKELKEKCEKEKLSNVIDSLINTLREMNESRKEEKRNKRVIPKIYLNVLKESVKELNKFNATKMGRFCYANMKNMVKNVSEDESKVNIIFATTMAAFLGIVLNLKNVFGGKIRIYGSSNDKLKPQQVVGYEVKDDRVNIYIKKRLVGRLTSGEQAIERLKTYEEELRKYVDKYYNLISNMEI